MNEGMKEILEWQLTGGPSMINYGTWFDENEDGKIPEEEFSKDRFKTLSHLGVSFSELDINKDKIINEEDFRIIMEPYKLELSDANTPVIGAIEIQEVIKISNKENITIDIFEG
ncbi:hypothetical protein AN639_11850 [Candidatus Epulonipiscium fishelsonii]|uniref:Uncharacterized protein n=1 Tax=Candidatus Epulonipiscium fishelsonii TaxID=77094 RepID=A0ACC8XFT0_9FIRM|nr:hypothetical protein AN396_02140 [Epulopiscium sp. SCG-B11WGA-EpuloA1]ONI42859.1 hypothetical protein AN639_11850 [Epulopiscium sp. SCG-B05WGA-EpuloA1]